VYRTIDTFGELIETLRIGEENVCKHFGRREALQIAGAKAFHQTLIVRATDEGASADHCQLSLGAANLDWLGETLKPGMTLVFDCSPVFCGPRVGRAAVWIAEARMLCRSLKSFAVRIVV
jgi:hypothetical protein